MIINLPRRRPATAGVSGFPGSAKIETLMAKFFGQPLVFVNLLNKVQCLVLSVQGSVLSVKGLGHCACVR